MPWGAAAARGTFLPASALSISNRHVLKRAQTDQSLSTGLLVMRARTVRGGEDGKVVDELLHLAVTAPGKRDPGCTGGFAGSSGNWRRILRRLR